MKGGIQNLINAAEFVLKDANSTLDPEAAEILEHALHSARQEHIENEAVDSVEAAVANLEDAVLGVVNPEQP